jgi:hypothetical protein
MVNQSKVLSKRHSAKLSKLNVPQRKAAKAKYSKITTSFNRNQSMVS